MKRDLYSVDGAGEGNRFGLTCLPLPPPSVSRLLVPTTHLRLTSYHSNRWDEVMSSDPDTIVREIYDIVFKRSRACPPVSVVREIYDGLVCKRLNVCVE